MLNLDLISSTINLTQNNLRRHSSYVGVCLSITLVITTLSFATYSSLELFVRAEPFSNSYTKFQDDAGDITLGQEGIFHVYRMMNTLNASLIYEPDFRYYNIVGTLMTSDGEILAYYSYDRCIWDFDGNGVEKFFDRKNFERSLCIRKSENVTTGEVIINNSENKGRFKYPSIKHGMETHTYEGKTLIYKTQGKECRNLPNCASKEDIEKFIVNTRYSFLFIDNYFDITDYKEPIHRNLNGVSGVMSTTTYVSNHLNFNPVTIATTDNWVFTLFTDMPSYILYQNEKIADSKEDTGILFNVNFWLKNQGTFYKRSYKRAQDIIASIGGFMNSIFYMSLVVNYLTNKFQIIINTTNLLQNNKFVLESIHKQGWNESSSTNSKTGTACSNRTTPDGLKRAREEVETNVEIPRNTRLFYYKKFVRPGLKGMISYFWKSLCCKAKDSNVIYDFRAEILSENVFFTMFLDLVKIKKLFLKPEDLQRIQQMEIQDQDIRYYDFNKFSQQRLTTLYV